MHFVTEDGESATRKHTHRQTDR